MQICILGGAISQLDWLLSNLVVNPKYGGFAKLYLERRDNTEVCSNLIGGLVQLLIRLHFHSQLCPKTDIRVGSHKDAISLAW